MTNETDSIEDIVSRLREKAKSAPVVSSVVVEEAADDLEALARAAYIYTKPRIALENLVPVAEAVAVLGDGMKVSRDLAFCARKATGLGA